MKLLVLDENYPHLNNLMGDVFVHVRVKAYQKVHSVKVFSFFKQSSNLNYEGVDLYFFENEQNLINGIKKFEPDAILIHFYQSWMLEKIIKKINIPFIIWVHGYEALGWYRRLFNFSLYSPVLFNYIRRNTKQQFHFRKLVKFANANSRINFVFVSDWMRRVTESDCLTKVENKYIIPNPIDTNLFLFREKNPELRKKILLLRSFSSRKYANDISAAAIQILAKRPFFSDLQFDVVGSGQLFGMITEKLRRFSNVSLKEDVIQQVRIPEVHSKFGLFLCPTRQDAQGVSMCEAMSSGLVPLTSNNTAIPEFVRNMETGFLTNDAKDIADAIELLYYKPEIFLRISANAAESIRQSCSINIIIQKELSLIENLVC